MGFVTAVLALSAALLSTPGVLAGSTSCKCVRIPKSLGSRILY